MQFAQNPDGSVAFASGDGRQSVSSAAAKLDQQQRILEAAFRADRAREKSGTETEGRVAEREFIGQYNAQDLDQQQRVLRAASKADRARENSGTDVGLTPAPETDPMQGV